MQHIYSEIVNVQNIFFFDKVMVKGQANIVFVAGVGLSN